MPAAECEKPAKNNPSRFQEGAALMSKYLRAHVSASHRNCWPIHSTCIQPHRHIHSAILRNTLNLLACLVKELRNPVVLRRVFSVRQPQQHFTSLRFLPKLHAEVIHPRHIYADFRKFRNNDISAVRITPDIRRGFVLNDTDVPAMMTANVSADFSVVRICIR